MSLVQVPCEETTRKEIAGQWGKGNATVLFLVLLLVLSGCHKPYVIIVDVPVKPKFTPPGNIREFEVRAFEGPTECASDLQKGIHARAANAGDLAPAIPGLPDLDGPLEVKGKVDACSMRMGYGMLNATMMLSHGGKQLYQEVVREETNRPGASPEEVRATLVDRVIKRFASIFVSGKKQEVRELRPQGASDPGLIAAREKNWKLAIQIWGKRVKEDPKDHRDWYNRGVAYEGDGQLPEAVNDYKKAVELERDELYMTILSRAEKSFQDNLTTEVAKKSRE